MKKNGPGELLKSSGHEAKKKKKHGCHLVHSQVTFVKPFLVPEREAGVLHPQEVHVEA